MVYLDQRDRLAYLEFKAQVEGQEVLDPSDLQDHLVRPDQQEPQDLTELSVPLVRREREVL